MHKLESFKKKIFILSISSDIGYELAIDWINKGHNVYGTFKNFSDKCKILKNKGAKIYKLDLKKNKNVTNFFSRKIPKWDWLIIATG